MTNDPTDLSQLEKQPMHNRANDEPSSASGFGSQFYQTRVAQNKTLDDATKELHILKRHLQAIENEDFAQLPQMAFARGFVHNYAKYLGLNAEQMVEKFNAIYPADLQHGSSRDVHSPLKPMGTLNRDNKRKLRINPLLILGAVLLLILAVFLIRAIANAQSDTQNDSVTVVDTISEQEQTAGASVTANSSATLTPTDTSAQNTGNTLSVTEINDSAQQPATPLVDEQTLANTPQSTLDFWVRDDAGIEVTDASGQSLLSGQQPRGGYQVVGKPPFTILIDNARNVALTIDQERVQVNDYAQNNQANFTLSP